MSQFLKILQEGHIAAECPEPQKCRRCRSEDHVMADCPEPAKCMNCREEGHTTSECPLPEMCRRCKKVIYTLIMKDDDYCLNCNVSSFEGGSQGPRLSRAHEM